MNTIYPNFSNELIQQCQQVVAVFKSFSGKTLPDSCDIPTTDEGIVKALINDFGLDLLTAIDIVNNVKLID